MRILNAGRPDAEEGTASVFVLGVVVVLMMVAGLVVDGGRAVNGRSAAMDAAEQAARVGANQLTLGSTRGLGGIRLDPMAARTAAVEYLTVQGYDASGITVVADENQVTVIVRDEVPTVLLSLAMISSFEVEGRATARAVVGVRDEIPGGAP
jgi:Flp pilus assembly protein TadG